MAVMVVERLVARVVVEERTVAGVKAVWAATARAAGATGARVSEARVAAARVAATEARAVVGVETSERAVVKAVAVLAAVGGVLGAAGREHGSVSTSGR